MVRSYRQTLPISLLRHLLRAARELERIGAETAGEFDLSLSELNVIDSLGNTEGLRMGEVAQRMLVSAPNVTRLVKKLEAAGVVRRSASEHSDREVIVRLTSTGEALFERTYPTGVAAVRQHFEERLSRADQEALLALLHRLNRSED